MTNRSGAILIIVMVVLMMVSLAAYQFTISMESEHVATHNGSDLAVARHCALSGVEFAAGVLNTPRAQRPRWEQILNTTVNLWPTESQSDERYLARIVPANRFGESSAWDESAKLNLRTLLDWDIRHPGSARQALMNLPDMDETTADHLLDWIDADSQVRSQGNENGVHNAPPLCVDLLAFLGSHSMEELSGSIDRKPAWLAYLTVHSAERNTTWDGLSRIDLNSDDLGELHRLLRERTSAAIADYVVWARQYGVQNSLGSSNDSGLVPEDSSRANGLISVDLSIPPTAKFESLADLINSSVIVPASATSSGQDDSSSSGNSRQRILSPLRVGAGVPGGGPSTEKSIDELFDQFTLTPQKRLHGRINILTAPIEVLAGVPNLSKSTAEQIVSQRENSSHSLRHPIGLLSSLAADSTMVREVLPYLTVTSDAIHVRVSGWIGQPETASPVLTRPTYHCDVVLDASSGPARPVLYRQLTGSNPIVPSDSISPETAAPTIMRSTPAQSFPRP